MCISVQILTDGSGAAFLVKCELLPAFWACAAPATKIMRNAAYIVPCMQVMETVQCQQQYKY